MKFPKPFFRKSKQAWYVQLGKKQHSLGKDREEAYRRYRELLLHEEDKAPDPTKPLTVAEVSDLYLEWCSRHNNGDTYKWYKHFLQSFSDLQGGRKTTELKVFHVTAWLDAKPPWGEATRRCAIIALKRAFNWAETEGHLSVNLLAILASRDCKNTDARMHRSSARIPPGTCFQGCFFRIVGSRIQPPFRGIMAYGANRPSEEHHDDYHHHATRNPEETCRVCRPGR